MSRQLESLLEAYINEAVSEKDISKLEMQLNGSQQQTPMENISVKGHEIVIPIGEDTYTAKINNWMRTTTGGLDEKSVSPNSIDKKSRKYWTRISVGYNNIYLETIDGITYVAEVRQWIK